MVRYGARAVDSASTICVAGVTSVNFTSKFISYVVAHEPHAARLAADLSHPHVRDERCF